MRKHDPLPGHTCETDVRQRGERTVRALHLRERTERCGRACAVVRAERRDIEIAQARGHVARRYARERLAVTAEGQQRHDR